MSASRLFEVCASEQSSVQHIEGLVEACVNFLLVWFPLSSCWSHLPKTGLLCMSEMATEAVLSVTFKHHVEQGEWGLFSKGQEERYTQLWSVRTQERSARTHKGATKAQVKRIRCGIFCVWVRLHVLCLTFKGDFDTIAVAEWTTVSL